jgi:hypothetical protein
LQIRKPDGTAAPLDDGQRAFTQTDVPGIYTIDSPAGSRLFAVNLSAKECQTAVMPVEDIESLGVSVRSVPVRAYSSERLTASLQTARDTKLKRHRDFAALESEQKLWRWVFALLLAFSLVEMALAGWLTRTPWTLEGQQK